MKPNFVKTYEELYDWCRREQFSGYDPFDGLNSRIFQSSPLKNLAAARLVWLQIIKRSPVNLRKFLLIEKGTNPKGTALFALAELSRFRTTKNSENAQNVRKLLEQLCELRIEFSKTGDRGPKTAFGYNFDWQSRAFFAPRGTPTIVPTAFAARAFIETYELFESESHLETACEICEFICADLNRPHESTDEICFSYTPLDKSVIYNASLLSGETLASVGAITGNQNYLQLAEKAARFVVRRQQANGAWAYGSKLRHRWIDNFHTAYILLSLYRIQKLIPALQSETEIPIKKGLDFWLENFFLADGAPKYFDGQTFPIDIHSASAAIIALCELNDFDARCQPLAEKVAAWTIENMRDDEGFFYYQKRKSSTVKIPFIRWSQAWTAYALARLIESIANE